MSKVLDAWHTSDLYRKD